MDSLDMNIYIILETEYKRKHEIPLEWYSVNCIKLKCEILAKALNNNLKVEETEEYKHMMEVNKDE